MNLIVQNSNDFISQFLLNYQSPATRDAYFRDLKEFFTHFSGQFSNPADITLSHLITYRDTLSNRGLSPATVNRQLSSIKSLMNWCMAQGLIFTNPASSLKLPKPAIQEPTLAFTDEEASQIIAAPDVTTFFGNLHRISMVMLFNLGLRRSELANLKMRDIYEDRGVKVLKIQGKGNKIRTLPLSGFVYSELRSYLANYEKFSGKLLTVDDYLLQSSASNKNEVSMSGRAISRTVGVYAKRLGIHKRVSAHSARATVISHLLENAVSPRDVADFAGHSSINTTTIYDKKRDGLKNSAAFKVNFSV